VSKSALLSARRSDASTQASGRKDPIIRAELLKTVLCRQWESGSCKFGARCHFAHGKADICDKRVPSNTLASIIQSRPDTHQDAAPIVRGLPQEKRENPPSATQGERDHPCTGKQKVGDEVTEAQSIHHSLDQSETLVGAPKIDQTTSLSNQKPAAVPRGTVDTRQVTFLDNGVVYIHDSQNPGSDKEEVFPTTAAVRAKEQRV
jgi:hypothetical protein